MWEPVSDGHWVQEPESDPESETSDAGEDREKDPANTRPTDQHPQSTAPALSAQLYATSTADTLICALAASAASARDTPLHVCLVLDRSASMSVPVTARDREHAIVEYDITVMDMVKYAARVALHCLAPGDRISVVSFADQARIDVPPTTLPSTPTTTTTTTGPAAQGNSELAAVVAGIDQIAAEGRTNLWAGLRTALTLLREHHVPGTHNLCIALTDGVPNCHPALGYVEAQRAFQNDPDFRYVLNTIPFGYEDMDAKLLHQLALQGGGIMVNVPDCGMVGTVLTNMLANAKTTTHCDLALHDPHRLLNRRLPCRADVAYDRKLGRLALGCRPCASDDEDESEDLEDFEDVDHHTVLKLDLSHLLTLRAFNVRTGQVEEVPVPLADLELPESEEARTLLRDAVCAEVRQLNVLMAARRNHTASQQLAAFLEDHDVLDLDPELFIDLNEQVRQALAPNAYRRWGHTYLPSLVMAYTAHLRHNFKDPGVQHFGGSRFRQLAAQMSDIFDSLPVPQPSLHTGRRLPSLAVLNDCLGGCYTGDSLVTLADGTVCRCDAVRPGFCLAGGARVAYVMATACVSGREDLCLVAPGLSLTPWHPICRENEWFFPADRYPILRSQRCAFKYSFILDAPPSRGAVVVVGGVSTVALGGADQARAALPAARDPNAVLEHAFFGTTAVRRRVAELAPLSSSRVAGRYLVLQPHAFIRPTPSAPISDIDARAVVPLCITLNPAWLFNFSPRAVSQAAVPCA
ncbi:uncharacterized protein MONBRDRAFT_12793 [Monosiga brevicollis MX1]|uniref:VWFA domain-containing protein n=1 Tax=Monosiga brevicollis TaxID=81824 RepID=A9VDB9_MONBE|nr:uncharacterized protein MONBRDRAFT_12793 [Monosiga brevicollis MX1]EDQ84419.1 predicted protein [Monosiga brevicollis MX1]|eukprot:XP_001750714.1 hypothetical protein [Monosiga brevicollis MX1]